MPKHFSSFSHRVAVAAVLAVLPMSLSAVQFDTTTVGGVATVGAGGDYTSLSDAAAAFNGLTSPFLQGHWKLEVIGDLSEAANSAFGNTIPVGSSLTLKPAATLTPTITFTAVADNAGTCPTGNIIVGNNSILTRSLVKTDRFIIDGSNTVSGTTRDLTLRNTAVTFSFSRIAVVVGDSDDCAIKNCRIINNATGGTTPAAVSVGLYFLSAVNYLPDGMLVDNNLLQAQGPAASGTIGVDVTKNANVTAVTTGLVISNNDIDVRQRGIYLNGLIEGAISGNSINVSGINTALVSYGIYGVSGSLVNNQTLNITNNNIYVGTSATAGGSGAIGLGLSSSVGTGCVTNVVNNMIHIESTAPTVSTSIRLSGTDLVSTMQHNLYHNSFYVSATGTISGQEPFTGSGSSPTAGTHGIGVSRAATAPVVNSQNNIVRVSVPNGSAIMRFSTGGTFTTNNNILSAATYTAAIPTANYTTLADWQATTGSPDPNSAVVNPLITSGSAWNPTGTTADLHFIPAATKPVELVGMPWIASVPNDIDGDTRNAGAGGTYPGADEGTVALPVTISSFELE